MTWAGHAALQRSRGFSLLEMMVAIAVLGLSVTLLYQVQAGLLRGVEDVETARKSNLLLRSLLDSRDSVPATGWTETGESGGLQWQVRSQPWPRPVGLTPDAESLHEVSIVISWRNRRGPGQLMVTTLLPQAGTPAGAPT